MVLTGNYIDMDMNHTWHMPNMFVVSVCLVYHSGKGTLHIMRGIL